jgi:hypothetical protein
MAQMDEESNGFRAAALDPVWLNSATTVERLA